MGNCPLRGIMFETGRQYVTLLGNGLPGEAYAETPKISININSYD
jgi:hypothetical protein